MERCSGLEVAQIECRCVAESEHLFNRKEEESSTKSNVDSTNNYFRSAQWTADGTSIITNSADNEIRLFIAPQNLLEENSTSHRLSPYSIISSFEPVNAVVAYPLFDLQDVSTTLILSSIRDHPVRLNSALSTAQHASYPLVNPATEAVITPHSLLFSDVNHFIAGSDSLISIFDLSRPGQEPISSIETGPRSRKSYHHNPLTSMRGIVSTVALEHTTNILAAGTFSRYLGLYDSAGRGECIGVFTVKDTEADKAIRGSGITKVAWSPCGRYLYIAERKSDGAMIYDIRKTGQLLAWLNGRSADTNQRLSFDLFPTDDGIAHEIWAGGTDGFVRMWKSPHLQEGSVNCTSQFKAHEDAISSVMVHKTGAVVATASGQRHFDEEPDSIEDLDSKVVDNSLRIWELDAKKS